MFTIWAVILIVLLTVLSAGISGWVLITTQKTFNKFNQFDISSKNKLLLMDYYMVFAREFTKDKLIRLSELPDEEIKKINKIHDIRERVKTAREKTNMYSKLPDEPIIRST
jgi:hypothetical protein